MPQTSAARGRTSRAPKSLATTRSCSSTGPSDSINGACRRRTTTIRPRRTTTPPWPDTNRLLASLEQVEAQSASTEAQIAQAKAGLQQAEADLDRAQVNLEYANIFSPVDGIVISRDVDVGQTIAASMSAPILFNIATDLSQMQVKASVDEADIGSISEDAK